MNGFTPPRAAMRRRGVALISVLVLLAAAAALASVMLERMGMAVMLTRNADVAFSQRYQAEAAEGLARAEIARLLTLADGRLTNAGDWNGRAITVPTPGGLMRLTVQDATACFNINGLVEPLGGEAGAAPVYHARREGAQQLVRLARSLGVPLAVAERLAATAADWMDSDALPLPNGAEDPAYARQDPAYRTAGTLMRSVDELRLLAGFDAAAFDRLRPWLCALPTAQPTPVNVNLLAPDQAPLVAMLHPALTVEAVAPVLLARPAEGYASAAAIWQHPALSGLTPSRDVLRQLAPDSAYFRITVSIESADGAAQQSALFARRTDGALELVTRQWQGSGA